ncbi:MAG: tripartite tricarboxylate transporter substrate binding protein [Polaromonas sp.]|uniref:Bug family tripartite tricarboxylate transporter substrate binding protein n=1 Tax=Polaromonas sp. TaxID=1869339 RepID=UPI0025E16935|nr:tripartite tricarboxylate transporter substrate binding protein [Polaromonas sp.]MBI2728426.1 tripartite tricarboxylate transporter substrate binding protein [Polaromonas sp.]
MLNTHKLNFARRAFVAMALLPMMPMMAAAQGAYPNKPVTIVVGYSAGGGVDAMARIMAEKLPSIIGQPVIVENRPSVGAIVGTSYVAKAKPDGYTLLMGAPGPIIFNHAVYAKLPYTPQELTPISFVSDSPLMLIVNASNPAKTVQELVAQSKQNPDKSNYGASSASFQLITELFKKKTGGQFTHIPYKGANDAVTAVMAGDITMALADAGPASVGLQSGRVKALAVTSAQRMKDYPNVPTLSELGIDLKVSLWIGLLAPAGVPADVMKTLQDAVAKAVAMPDVQKRMTTMSVIPMSNTSEEFAKVIASEIPVWKQLAIDNNIKAN